MSRLFCFIAVVWLLGFGTSLELYFRNYCRFPVVQSRLGPRHLPVPIRHLPHNSTLVFL